MFFDRWNQDSFYYFNSINYIYVKIDVKYQTRNDWLASALQEVCTNVIMAHLQTRINRTIDSPTK